MYDGLNSRHYGHGGRSSPTTPHPERIYDPVAYAGRLQRLARLTDIPDASSGARAPSVHGTSSRTWKSCIGS
jgi:hypothetical protein